MISEGVHSYADCVREFVVDGEPDEWRAVTADVDFLAALLEALHGADARPRVELFPTVAACDRLDRDFLTASRSRDLDVDGDVAVRTLPDDHDHVCTLLLSADGDEVWTVVPLGGGEAVLTAIEDGTAGDRLRDRYDSLWASAMPHTADAPPYSRLVGKFEAELGPEDRADLETAFGAAETRSPDDRLGPVALALLVAAVHRRQLRTVVDWATGVDLASQGTVSRTKTRLEDLGLLATEPVKNGVGRPRQRLVLADEAFETLSVDELVGNAAGIVG
jgi:hypothetical protein